MIPTYLAFFVLGMAANALSPSLELLRADLGVPREQKGIFISVQFFSDVLALLACAWLFRRVNVKWIFAGCGLLGGLGLVTLALAPNMLVACVGLAGLGAGTAGLAAAPNTAFVRLYPQNASARLNTLNFFYGPGAVIGPLIFAVGISTFKYTFIYWLIGFCLLALTPFLRMLDLEPQEGSNEPLEQGFYRKLVPMILLMALYVGMEIGFSTLISSQMKLRAGAPPSLGAVAVALFWAGVAITRFFGPWILKVLKEAEVIILGSILFAVASGMVLLGYAYAPIALVSSLLAGLGAGPIFPNILAIGNQRVRDAGFATSLMVASGALGASTLPAFQAWMGGKVDAAFQVPLVTALVVALGTFFFSKRRPNEG